MPLFPAGRKSDAEVHIRAEYRLEEYLTGMGMTDAFIPPADFSGLNGQDLYITAVVHKAVIDVNEEGSEAAQLQLW